jgi:predicted kinase
VGQSLIIFSGLPGTGKTTLARWLAAELDLPLLQIDDIAAARPVENQSRHKSFWSQIIELLLQQIDQNLQRGASVIVDSVFMGDDRTAAARLARKHAAEFFAIHTFCSDEELWRARVEKRQVEYRKGVPASWDQIIHQRKQYLPWDPADALFVDATNTLSENTEKVRNYISKAG